MDLTQFSSIKEFLDTLIENDTNLTNRTLSKGIGVNESYISKIRSGDIEPSKSFMDKLCDHLSEEFPAIVPSKKEQAMLKCLAGFVDKSYQTAILSGLASDEKPYESFKEYVENKTFYLSDSSDNHEPRVRISVIFPNHTEIIPARVLVNPQVLRDTMELRADFALEADQDEKDNGKKKSYHGCRAELGFRESKQTFYTKVEGRYIRFRTDVDIDRSVRVPLEDLQLSIFVQKESVEDFFRIRYKNVDEARFGAEGVNVASLGWDKIRYFIENSPVFDPRVHGKALYHEDPLRYQKIRFPRLSLHGGLQTALIGEVGEDTLNQMMIEVSLCKEEEYPQITKERPFDKDFEEQYDEVFELAKEDLESIGVFGIDDLSHKIKNEYESSGKSDSLAAYILIVCAHTNTQMPDNTVAIGALDGSSIKMSESLIRKLELLSDCRYLIIGASGYARAERFFAKLPPEQRPEIIALRERKDIFTSPLFKERLFPTEKDFAPSTQQIAESGIDPEDFHPLCGLRIPIVLMHMNVSEGFKTDQIKIEFTDDYADWPEELLPLVPINVKEFKREGRKRSSNFYYFNGDLANVDAVYLEAFESRNKKEKQAFRHHMSKAECDRYITQIRILDKPILQDEEGNACTVRRKYAYVGTELERSPLVKQLTATCHVIFTKNEAPYEILIGVRGKNLAGYADTYTSAMACCISVTDSKENMLKDPRKYKFTDRDAVQKMLDLQETKLPKTTPHPAISILREMSDESGIRIEIDDIMFLALTLNLKDYDLAWGSYVQIDATNRSPWDIMQSFKSEHTEFSELRLVRFDLHEILDLIDDEKHSWHVPALASLLMVLSRHFGEERVRDEITRRRNRKLWLA